MLIEYHGSGERYSGTLLMTSLPGNKVLCPTLSQERDLLDLLCSKQAVGLQRSKESKSSGGMPLNQARMLSGNQLVRTFSRFEGDEMKRIFSFQCLLIPRKCKVRFESFGSETKARSLVKDHLLQHLETLQEGELSNLFYVVVRRFL